MNNEPIKKTVYVCCGTGCLVNNNMDVYKDIKNKIEELKVNAEEIIKETIINGKVINWLLYFDIILRGCVKE